jgi:hypothetical protein
VVTTPGARMHHAGRAHAPRRLAWAGWATMPLG